MNRCFEISAVDWTATRNEKRRSIGFRVTRTTFLQGQVANIAYGSVHGPPVPASLKRCLLK